MTESERRIYPASMWLEKMDHDLETIRLLRNVDEAPKDVLCFHAQQAVEKGLKAILAAHGTEPEKTHDVLVLLDEVLPLGAPLEDEAATISVLNGYSVGVRYPFHLPNPSANEARIADETARRVCEVCRKFVSEYLKNNPNRENV